MVLIVRWSLVRFHCTYFSHIVAIEYAHYVSSLPSGMHPHLDKQLDWDNDVDADLKEIAHYIEDWDSNLASHLKLTEADTNNINSNEDVLSQR